MANEYSFSLDSALANSNDSKRKALEAVAQGGKAGLDAYNAAQKDLATQRTGALDAAMERSRDTGGGANTGQEFLTNTFNRNQSSLSNLSAASQDRFANMGASNASYFDKLNATLPLLANQNREKAMTQENKIKATIAEAQAAAEARAKEKQADREFQLARDAARESAADKRAAAKDSAGKVPTLDELLGAAFMQQEQAKGIVQGSRDLNAQAVTPVSGNPFSKLPAGTARYERQLAGQATNADARAAAGPAAEAARQASPYLNMDVSELAYQLGQAAGVPQNKLAGLYAPGKQAAIASSIKKLTPQQTNEVAKAIATKYDTRGVTQAVASTIIKDPDFKAAVADLTQKFGEPAAGWTREYLQQELTKQFKNKPRTLEVLLGEYVSKFPSSSQTVTYNKAQADLG